MQFHRPVELKLKARTVAVGLVSIEEYLYFLPFGYAPDGCFVM